MKTLILNYYKKATLATTAEEAVNFINSLDGIQANQSTIKNLQDFFNGDNKWMMKTLKSGYAYEIATTGCGMSRILCYRPLASTLEEHNILVAKNKEKKAEEEAEKRHEREQAHLSDMYEQNKGWYIVTVTGNAFKFRGNDGKVTKSVKVLAENKMQAYNLAVQNLEENPPKNVMNWIGFESSRSALIEYVGVWTDESEL